MHIPLAHVPLKHVKDNSQGHQHHLVAFCDYRTGVQKYVIIVLSPSQAIGAGLMPSAQTAWAGPDTGDLH